MTTTAQDILTRAESLGVSLWHEGDMLHYRGDSQAVAKLLPELKAHKAELLAELAVRRWLPGGECYERIRSGWRLSRTEDGNYVWREPGTWEGAA